MSIQSAASVNSNSASVRGLRSSSFSRREREVPTRTRPRKRTQVDSPTPQLEALRRRGLARNIRRAAHARGLGLNQLSDLAGVSRAQLYAVLGGKSSPSLEWLCKVADALDLHPSALLEDLSMQGHRH